MRRFALIALAAAATACSDPNNQVYGGLNSSPPLVVRKVNSTIFGTVTTTNQAGKETTQDAVILSESDNLCGLLQQNPDLFKRTDLAYNALILMFPHNRLGSFNLVIGGDVAATFMASSGSSDGSSGSGIAFFGGNGYISVGDFDPGGNAKGNFDLIFFDSAQDSFEAYGNFQSDPCAAMTTAYIPRFDG
ncbi:MAG: hypothetical protein JST92_20925 [Deltaproteobacteria bacterium]|nr:hypothetical protein [Deltaproteobacteria bacterium]